MVVWGILSLLYVCLFVCHFLFFTVKDFSVAEKDRGVKFCICVGLLSGQAFSHFGGQRSRSPGTKNADTRDELAARYQFVTK